MCLEHITEYTLNREQCFIFLSSEINKIALWMERSILRDTVWFSHNYSISLKAKCSNVEDFTSHELFYSINTVSERSSQPCGLRLNYWNSQAVPATQLRSYFPWPKESFRLKLKYSAQALLEQQWLYIPSRKEKAPWEYSAISNSS